jgi:hypothetical protein
MRRTPRCLVVPLLTTQKPRGVFVKTVFSTFERLDSMQGTQMRGWCHLFVKRKLQTREERGEHPGPLAEAGATVVASPLA